MGVQNVDVSWDNQRFEDTPLGQFAEQTTPLLDQIQQSTHDLIKVKCRCGYVFNMKESTDISTSGMSCPECGSFTETWWGMDIELFWEDADREIDIDESYPFLWRISYEYQWVEKSVDVMIDKEQTKIGKSRATCFLTVGWSRYKVECRFKFGSEQKRIFDGSEWLINEVDKDEFEILEIKGKSWWRKKRYMQTQPSKKLQDILNTGLKRYIKAATR